MDFRDLAPVVQTLDAAIHRINVKETHCPIHGIALSLFGTAEPRSENGCENVIFWTEIESGLGEPDVKTHQEFPGVLYSTANDPETLKDPQNEPQMILDRKLSLKSTANDPVKT